MLIAVLLLLSSLSSTFSQAQEIYLPLNEQDMRANAALLPTTYFVAQEELVPCQGRYRGREFNGTEVAPVLKPDGQVIAEVCERFLQVLKMEGTGILKDRGQGRITVNWAGNGRFLAVDTCVMGLGVGGRCLLPYYTFAADLAQYTPGTMLYVPRARGLILPDGSLHQGFFLVRDTGGAFHGIGRKRVDIFVGLEDDANNVFSRSGFHHRREEESFIITGETKQRAMEFLKNNFGPLYNDF